MIPEEKEQLIRIVEELPENEQHEVLDFVEFLRNRLTHALGSGVKASGKKRAAGLFGCLKDKVKMSDDFDEPLEEFADYM